jgi:hypothetical protein
MRKLWHSIRCRLTAHRWQQTRVEGVAALVCRDCGKLYFGEVDAGRPMTDA